MTRDTAPRNWCILLLVAFNYSQPSAAVPLEALSSPAGEENEVFGRVSSASQHNDAGYNPLGRLSERNTNARRSLREIMRLLKAKIHEKKRNDEGINDNEIGADQINAEGSAIHSDTDMVQGEDASLEAEGSGDTPLHGFPPGINEVVYAQHHKTPEESSILPHSEVISKADEAGEGLFSNVWHKTNRSRNHRRKHGNRWFSGGQSHGKNKNDSHHKGIVDDKESLKLPLDPGEKPWIYDDDYYNDDYNNDWSDYYEYYYDDDDTDTVYGQVSSHAEGEDESSESSDDNHKTKRNSSTPSPSSTAATTQAGVFPSGTTQQDVNPGTDGNESGGAPTSETGATDFASTTTQQIPTTELNDLHNTNLTVTDESTSSEPAGNRVTTADSNTIPSETESSEPEGNETTTAVDSTTIPSETESSEPEGSDEITTAVDSTTMSSETESSEPEGNEVTTVDSTTIPTDTENAHTEEVFTTEEGDAPEVGMTTLATTTAQSEFPSNEDGSPGNESYPTTLVELNDIQPPLRDYIIDKLSDQFLGMAEELHKPNVSNPYPDIKDVLIKTLSSFRVDRLSTVTKRSIPDGTGSSLRKLHFWVNGIKFPLTVPRYPDFIQAGDTEVKNIVINRKRMYVYLQLRFNSVTVPIDFNVKADLFPPFFSIPNTEGSAEISMDYILIPLRIPYQLFFQKRKNLDGTDTALGILVPDDFVSHGVSMVGVSTKILGCKEKDFMAKRVLRFEEHLKNALELWLSGEPLATLADSLRQQLLKKARETASLSLQRTIID